MEGDRCPICSGNKKHTIEELKKQTLIIASNYKLISKIYKDNKTKLDFLCPKNHKFSMEWNSFRTGIRCPVCSNKKKHTIEDLKKKIKTIEPNYELLSTKYKNNYTKLRFKCNKGHIYKVTWNDFHQGCRCPECRKLNYTEDELKQYNNYKKLVRNITDKNFKNYFDIINPNNKERGFRKYHVDHIFSVMEGFRLGIEPEIIANPYNLQMLWWKKNIIKSDKLWQSEKKLYQGYARYTYKRKYEKGDKNILNEK